MDDYKKLEVLKLAFDEFQKQANPNHNGHADRCGLLCSKFARYLKGADEYNSVIDEDFIVDLRWSALVHDIAKARISPRILNFPGALSEDDWLIVKAHPNNAFRIINAINIANKNIPLTVLHHHERWDGNGYPFGLKEFNIPLSARILRVGDTFDAMTNDRPYRERFLTTDHALADMLKTVGTELDPSLFSWFYKFMSKE